MGETDPQLGINGYLPALIPDRYFNNPFYARIACNWWTHPELETLRDAIAPTVEHSLSPAETLAFAKEIEDEFLYESGCEIHSGTIWKSWGAGETTVDEAGIVRAVIGKITDVKEYFEDYELDEEAEEVVDKLYEVLCDAIIYAARQWQGEDFADELDRLIGLEEDRRIKFQQSLRTSAETL